MTQAEIKGCIYLMSQLWSNYKPPATEVEISALTNVWMRFFGNAPSEKITNVIMAIAAEGGEFAPQVGQIYSRYKAEKAVALEGRKHSEEYYYLCRLYAKVCGVEPPDKSLCIEELRAWFEKTRANN